jgi:hypothetical protein
MMFALHLEADKPIMELECWRHKHSHAEEECTRIFPTWGNISEGLLNLDSSSFPRQVNCSSRNTFLASARCKAGNWFKFLWFTKKTVSTRCSFGSDDGIISRRERNHITDTTLYDKKCIIITRKSFPCIKSATKA